MRVGIAELFDGTEHRGVAYARDFAVAMEEIGFDSLWAPEHVVFFETYESEYPYPPAPGSPAVHSLQMPPKAGCFDPLLVCQGVAMATTRLRVGTSIMILPLRHPLVWARQVATVDHFSGGRFDFGVGVGWLREEYDALDVPFASRGRRADEYLQALKAAWTQEKSTFEGEFVSFRDAWCYPKPVQSPHPPLLIGGQAPAALRRVARHGDGWFGWNLTAEETADALIGLDAALDAVGRPRDAVKRQVGLHWHKPFDDSFAALVDGYRTLGLDEIVVSASFKPPAFEARLTMLADAVGVRAAKMG